jgi:hypothetical protein
MAAESRGTDEALLGGMMTVTSTFDPRFPFKI